MRESFDQEREGSSADKHGSDRDQSRSELKPGVELRRFNGQMFDQLAGAVAVPGAAQTGAANTPQFDKASIINAAMAAAMAPVHGASTQESGEQPGTEKPASASATPSVADPDLAMSWRPTLDSADTQAAIDPPAQQDGLAQALADSINATVSAPDGHSVVVDPSLDRNLVKAVAQFMDTAPFGPNLSPAANGIEAALEQTSPAMIMRPPLGDELRTDAASAAQVPASTAAAQAATALSTASALPDAALPVQNATPQPASLPPLAEAGMSPEFTAQWQALLTQVKAEYAQDLAAARSPSSPYWTAVSQFESGAREGGGYSVDVTDRVFDAQRFQADWFAAPRASTSALAAMYGAPDVQTLLTAHPGIAGLLTKGEIKPTEAPLPPGLVAASSEELAGMDQYLRMDRTQALIQLFGQGPVEPPNNPVAQLQVQKYGQTRYEMLTRLDRAMRVVQNSFTAELTKAANDPTHTAPGWTVGQDGLPWFDAAVWSDAYISVNDPLHAAFGELYGSIAHLDEGTAKLKAMSQSYGSSESRDGGFDQSNPPPIPKVAPTYDIVKTMPDGQLRRIELRTASTDGMAQDAWQHENINDPSKFHSNDLVVFDPSFGWVTPKQNVDHGTDWAELVITAGLVAAVSWFAWPLAQSMAGAAMAATGTGAASAAAGGAVMATGAAGGVVGGLVTGTVVGAATELTQTMIKGGEGFNWKASATNIATSALAGGVTGGMNAGTNPWTKQLGTQISEASGGVISIQGGQNIVKVATSTFNGGLSAGLTGQDIGKGMLGSAASSIAQIGAREDLKVSNPIAQNAIGTTARGFATGQKGEGLVRSVALDMTQTAVHEGLEHGKPETALPVYEDDPGPTPPGQQATLPADRNNPGFTPAGVVTEQPDDQPQSEQSQPAEATAAQPKPPQSVTVRPGQTLESIARERYGEDWRAGLVAMGQANDVPLNRFGSPMIRAGQELQTPDISGADQATIDAANRSGGRIVNQNQNRLDTQQAREQELARAAQTATDRQPIQPEAQQEQQDQRVAIDSSPASTVAVPAGELENSQIEPAVASGGNPVAPASRSGQTLDQRATNAERQFGVVTTALRETGADTPYITDPAQLADVAERREQAGKDYEALLREVQHDPELKGELERRGQQGSKSLRGHDAASMIQDYADALGMDGKSSPANEMARSAALGGSLYRITHGPEQARAGALAAAADAGDPATIAQQHVDASAAMATDEKGQVQTPFQRSEQYVAGNRVWVDTGAATSGMGGRPSRVTSTEAATSARPQPARPVVENEAAPLASNGRPAPRQETSGETGLTEPATESLPRPKAGAEYDKQVKPSNPAKVDQQSAKSPATEPELVGPPRPDASASASVPIKSEAIQTPEKKIADGTPWVTQGATTSGTRQPTDASESESSTPVRSRPAKITGENDDTSAASWAPATPQRTAGSEQGPADPNADPMSGQRVSEQNANTATPSAPFKESERQTNSSATASDPDDPSRSATNRAYSSPTDGEMERGGGQKAKGQADEADHQVRRIVEESEQDTTAVSATNGSEKTREKRTSKLDTEEFLNSLKPPNRRHFANRINAKSTIKPDNTIIDQSVVNVDADVDGIRNGMANRSGEKFEINGRVYGVHGSTLFPISGDGVYEMDRASYNAYKTLNTHGLTTSAMEELDRKGIDVNSRARAIKIWKIINHD